jgi:uncharacterized protein (DUF1800 family)
MRGTHTADDGLAAASTTLPRRQVLRTGALGAVGAAGIAAALLRAPEADAATRASSGATASFVPGNHNLHLLRRATFGATPAMVARIKKMGPEAWLDQQLKPATIPDTACTELIAQRLPMANWTIGQAMSNLPAFSWDAMQQLGYAAVTRAAWSTRQLFEVMVDFWSNHLNVTNPSDGVWATRPDYDRRVIRAHALGKFSAMLRASATHPAMMVYLNNAESTKEAPNENYGRELLELHTVGVEAGYTETDMYNSALIMTGFGIDWDKNTFLYNSHEHVTGRVKVMKWTSANTASNGYNVGLAYVDWLAHHPATAKHIAQKLCTRFVSDVPPPALVSKLASTYLKNDTAIAPVLRELFTSIAFADAVGSKVQRPFEDVAATLRILSIHPDGPPSVDGLQGLYWMIQGLDHAPMAWAEPNGYPDTADAWRSAGGLVGRWNAHMSLAAHWWPNTLQPPKLRDLLPAKLPKTYGGFVDALSQRLVFRTLAPAHRDAVLAFIGKTAGQALTASDPAMTWRLPYIVSLILDSPYFTIR